MGPPGPAGPEAWSWIRLAADSVNSAATPAPVAGMSFTAAADTTYLVDVIGAYQSAAGTTGVALSLDIPTGAVIGQMIAHLSAVAIGGTEQIADSATTGATSGVRAANTNTPATARFVVVTGATGGTVQLQLRSEVAGSAVTLKSALTIMGWRAIP